MIGSDLRCFCAPLLAAANARSYLMGASCRRVNKKVAVQLLSCSHIFIIVDDSKSFMSRQSKAMCIPAGQAVDLLHPFILLSGLLNKVNDSDGNSSTLTTVQGPAYVQMPVAGPSTCMSLTELKVVHCSHLSSSSLFMSVMAWALNLIQALVSLFCSCYFEINLLHDHHSLQGTCCPLRRLLSYEEHSMCTRCTIVMPAEHITRASWNKANTLM